MSATATSEATDRVIELENIGPHAHLRLSAPPGKITVLVGPNGIGKTQVLDAVDSIQRKKSDRKLSSRDGTVGGSASFAGAEIRVARGGANRKSGDLVIESLEDRLSIATFVDPAKKDPHAADEQRIRALLLLAGAKADLARFRELAPEGEEWEAIVSSEAVKETDVVKMAARVKADFEAAARRIEEAKTKQETEKAANVKANEGIDLTQPHDDDELDAARDTARDNWMTLREQRRAGLESQETVAIARETVAKLEKEYKGSTIQQAEAVYASFQEAHSKQEDVVRELEEQLAKARSALVSRKHDMESAEQRLQAAHDHFNTLSAWKRTIEEGAADPPSEKAVEEAERQYLETKRQAEIGVLVREALKRQRAIELAEDRIAGYTRRADSLRSAARNTQVVLSKMVGELGVPLKVDSQLRLVSEHPARGECYFDELSMGEKWRIGIDIVLGRAGDDPAMLVIPQEAWESLDAKNRQAIRDHIAGTNVSILTAEAQHTDWSEPELTASTYE